jgi:16S rRNA (cytidine1402-2'-O)-methyltransferase
MTDAARTGTLYVVATPIGNLGDLGARAADVLKRVRTIAAEDTRRTRVLLADIGASPARLLSLADHNEGPRSAEVLDILQRGDDVALVSDAGTPLLSDPGFELVRAAHARGISVVPIPGPSAVAAALSVSPLPVDRFRFEGFLPAKPQQRRKRLLELAAADVSIVCFEAARRLGEMIADVADLLGADRPVYLAKELTKVHERLLYGTAASLAERVAADPELALGEYVVVVAPAAARTSLDETARRFVRVLCEELAPTQAARLAAKAFGLPKQSLYDYAMTLREADE